MSRPNITIENHGNVYFCCKCFCICGKGCKCEASKCSSVKINELSSRKQIGKKASSMEATKEQIDEFIPPPHRTICLDCKNGFDNEKNVVYRSKSRSRRSSKSEHQAEKQRSFSAGSSPASTAREPASLDYKFGLAESKNAAKRSSVKSGESSQSASEEKTLENLSEKNRKSRRSASKERILEHELEKSGEFKRSEAKDRVLEELMDNSRKSRRSSKHSRKSKKSRADSSFSTNTAQSPSLSESGRKSKRSSKRSRKLKQTRVDSSLVDPAQSPIFLHSKIGPSGQTPVSSQSLPVNGNEQSFGKVEGAQRLFGTSERVTETVQELRKEDRGPEAEKSTRTAKEKKSRRSSKRSKRSSKKSRDSKKSARTGDDGSKKRLGSSFSTSKVRDNFLEEKRSSKVGKEMRKSDKELGNNVQGLVTNEVVTARESQSLTNVNANQKDNVRGNSTSETSINAENIERKTTLFGESVYLAPQVESGRSTRLDVESSERKVEAESDHPKHLAVASSINREQERVKEENFERDVNVSDGVTPKIGGNSGYLTPQMSSSRSKRLSAVSSERKLDFSQENGQEKNDKLESGRKVEDGVAPNVGGNSTYLAPQVESNRLFGASQESVKQVGSEQNAESQPDSKIGGNSVYLTPQMDLGRSKRLNADESERKMTVTQEKSGSESKADVSDESACLAPQIESDRLERLDVASQGQDDSTPRARQNSARVTSQLGLFDKASTSSKSSSSKSFGYQMEAHQSRVTTDGSTKTQESMDIFFLQKKHIELKANVDGAPLTTTLTLNVKTKNKDAKIEMQEMWVDGERVFSRENTTKK